jgi:hypothetical protein
MPGRRCPTTIVVFAMMGCAPGAKTVEPSDDAVVDSVRVPDTAATADDLRAESPSPSANDFDALAVAPRPDAPPTAGSSSCTVKVQIQDAGTFPGRGVSTVTAEQASRAAWNEACRAVADATGTDCHDSTRVRVASISSSTRMVLTAAGTETEHEHAIELVTFREATGSSNAAATHQEACQLATDDACRAAIGQTCPSTGVRLIEIDGAPTYDETWVPPTTDTPDRVTI